MYRLLLCILLSQNLNAGGWGFHLISTERALQLLPAGALKSLLLQNKISLLNGSIYPDGGYMNGKEALAEWTHEKFPSEAMGKLEQTSCKNFSSHQCQQELTFVMGVAAHIMGDCNFDRYFLKELAKAEFNNDMDAAQKFSDLRFDTVIIKGYGRDNKVPPFYQAYDLAFAVYQEQGFRINKKDLSEMQTYQRVLYTALTSYATHSAERISKLSPWGTANYKNSRGGVEETAQRIAKLWQEAWKIVVRTNGKKLPRFLVYGGWPNKEIEVN